MMIQRLVTLVVCVSLAVPYFPAPAGAQTISLSAPSAILLDPASGTILYSKSPHRKQPPASTTKIVTALVVLDRLSLNHWVTVSWKAVDAQPSKLYLSGGERLTVLSLLKAILINSANDAAVALAIEVAGSESAFAEMMTEKARALGAKDTRFQNPHGLPAKGQYSTVYDLALIMKNAQQKNIIVSTLAKKTDVIQTAQGRRFHLKNHNKMLWRRSGVIGKTGWTRTAKHCFVGTIQQGSNKAIVALMGSAKKWSDLNVLADRVSGRSGAEGLLRFGDRGSEVSELQSALKRAGFFSGKPTGYFGPKTQRSVIQFQKSNQLTADGVVGSQTRRTLSSFW